MDPGDFVVGTRYLESEAEFVHWLDLRRQGFTEWYTGSSGSTWSDNRHVANAKARLYPDHLLQVRTKKEGRAVAYLATVPVYWSGDPQAFQDLHYIEEALRFTKARNVLLGALHYLTVEVLRAPRLFDGLTAGYRHRKVSGANSIGLIALIVDPAYQNQKLPSLLIRRVKENAERLGLANVLAPFRPSAYGKFKAERNAAHSSRLIEEYCALQDGENLPRDPWLRAVARQGARFVRIDTRAFRVSRSAEAFEQFRRTHHPDRWYSPIVDVWECGETPTWYVDRCRKQVLSVEPAVWGVIHTQHHQALA